MKRNECDSFTRAYIQAALWSSTEYKHGECPCCGRQALLTHFPEPEFEQEAMCNNPGCGIREIPNPDPMDSNYSESDLAPETLAPLKIIAALWLITVIAGVTILIATIPKR